MSKGTINTKYSGSFKQEVVEFMRENNLSCRDAAKKFGVNKTSINRWEHIYLEKGPEALYIEQKERTSKSSNSNRVKPLVISKELEEDLITENKRLRMENEYLKKLNALTQKKESLARKTKLK